MLNIGTAEQFNELGGGVGVELLEERRDAAWAAPVFDMFGVFGNQTLRLGWHCFPLR